MINLGAVQFEGSAPLPTKVVSACRFSKYDFGSGAYEASRAGRHVHCCAASMASSWNNCWGRHVFPEVPSMSFYNSPYYIHCEARNAADQAREEAEASAKRQLSLVEKRLRADALRIAQLLKESQCEL
jgi:hypothetical protein